MAREDWISEVFTSIDQMEADKFVSFLTEDAVFRYGSSPAVVGESAIKAHVEHFFGMFGKLSHKLLGSWNHSDAIFVQGEVTYTTHQGTDITLPFLNCFKMQGDKIKEYLIYIDPTPLAGSQ